MPSVCYIKQNIGCHKQDKLFVCCNTSFRPELFWTTERMSSNWKRNGALYEAREEEDVHQYAFLLLSVFSGCVMLSLMVTLR